MIREFWSPRVAIVFWVLWVVLTLALMLWSYANKSDRRTILKGVRAPIVSGVLALLLCVVMVIFLEALK